MNLILIMFILAFAGKEFGTNAFFFTTSKSISLLNRTAISQNKTLNASFNLRQRPKWRPTFRRTEMHHLCPTPCRCSVASVAICTRSNLTILPCDVLVRKNGEIVRENVFSSQLLSIYASHNRIWKIYGNCLAASGRKLQTISLRKNKICFIERDAFKGCAKLKTLDLSDNRLSSIVHVSRSSNTSTSFFTDLRRTITTLFLSGNRIANVPARSFYGFKVLEVLSLERNEIRWISLRAFRGLSSLKFLHLRGNPLGPVATTRISSNLAWFSNRFYFLSSNQAAFVANLSAQALCVDDVTDDVGSMISISELQLQIALWNMESKVARNEDDDDRRISTNDAIADLTNQRDLTALRQSWHNVSRNSFEQIKSSYPPATTNETLVVLDLGNLNLTDVPLGLPKSLKMLYLDKNAISYLSLAAFSEMVALQYLYLSYNQLQHLPAGTFSGLSHLHLLDLSSNDIQNLTSNSFCGLTSLITLKLGNNSRLKQLPNMVFDHSPFLGYLYLQNCGLTTLPGGSWAFGLIGLWLYGNPLHCECNSLAPILVKMTFGNPTPYRKHLHLDDFRNKFIERDIWQGLKPASSKCFEPSHLSDRLIKNMMVLELGCTLKDLARILTDQKKANPFLFKYESLIGNPSGDYEIYNEDISEISSDTTAIPLLTQPFYENGPLGTFLPNQSFETVPNQIATSEKSNSLADDVNNVFVDIYRNRPNPDSRKSRFTTRNAERNNFPNLNSLSSVSTWLTKMVKNESGKVVNLLKLLHKYDVKDNNVKSVRNQTRPEKVPELKFNNTMLVEDFGHNYLNQSGPLNSVGGEVVTNSSSPSEDDFAIISHLLQYENIDHLNEDYWRIYESNYYNEGQQDYLQHQSTESATNIPSTDTSISFEDYLNQWLNSTHTRQLKKQISDITLEERNAADYLDTNISNTKSAEKYFIAVSNFQDFPSDET